MDHSVIFTLFAHQHQATYNIITTEHRTENILYGLRTILPMFKQTLFIFQNMILNIQNMYLVDILYIQRNVLN